MRAIVLIGVAASLLGAVSGASARSLPIQHGVGIGPVKLGMSGTDVQKRLGRPRAVIERRVVRGQPYVEFEYDFGAWNVGFLGRKGQRRVVLVGTGLALHKSPEGVGVGTTERTFWRRVRGQGFYRRHCQRPDTGGTLSNGQHWVRRSRSSETVYFPAGRRAELPGNPPTILEVTGVEVRAAPVGGCAF
jgi:hypothetical protein